MPDTTINRYQTHPLIPLDTYPVGTTRLKMEVRGNAILSSIFIKSAGAGSVKVNYFQSTTGTFPEDGERHELDGHPIKSAADDGKTSQIIVTRVHNKPTVEFIVTGAPVEFGVYVTVTDELASDIDSALVLDGESADLLVNKGIPIACYNESSGLWEVIRCPFPVSFDEGASVHRNGSITTSNLSNNPNALDSFSVPVGQTYRFRTAIVSTRVSGTWTLTAGGATIAKGRTGPASMNSRFPFNPYREVSAGTAVSLTFNQMHQTPSDCDVDWFLMINQV